MEYLQQYQQLYNESPHRSLGQLSPFEVYFGRKPNRHRNKLFLGGKKDYEVAEENSNGIEMDECNAEELTELATENGVLSDRKLWMRLIRLRSIW